MLECRLDLSTLADGGAAWHRDGSGWVCGSNRITPYPHPAVEAALLTDPTGRVAVIVRERCTTERLPGPDPAALPAGHLDRLADLVDWPGETLLMEIDHGQVRMTTGRYGTAPPYLLTRGQVLHISWDLHHLAPLLDPDRLLDRAVTRALLRRWDYTCDTLWEGVVRLTERAEAKITVDGQIAAVYPLGAEHVAEPRRLRPGVDPIAALDALLTMIVQRLPRPPAGTVGVELSGGVDSANIAHILAATHPFPVRSYGLLVPDDPDQAARRQVLVNRLRLDDIPLDVGNYGPFSHGVRQYLHDPVGEMYAEARALARKAASAAGVRVIYTGFGGDEIMALRPSERPARPVPPLVGWLGPRASAALEDLNTNLAPVALAPIPSLRAFAVRNPPFLRAGMWPVSPLADPLLVRLGDSLAKTWRVNKHLLRERLTRAGYPRAVTHPRTPEGFGELMRRGMRRHGTAVAAQMLGRSRLIDLGFVDADRLAAALRTAQSAGTFPDRLYETLAVERGLESIAQTHHQQAPEVP